MATQSDRIEIEPRKRFQSRLRSPDDFKSIVSNQLVLDAVQDTLAHMALAGYARDQMDGAIAFAETFLNFAEPEPEKKMLPIKRLSIQ